jgi:hypothetical protein
LPEDVGQKIRDQAKRDHRRVRQQIEFLIIKTLREDEHGTSSPIDREMTQKNDCPRESDTEAVNALNLNNPPTKENLSDGAN